MINNPVQTGLLFISFTLLTVSLKLSLDGPKFENLSIGFLLGGLFLFGCEVLYSYFKKKYSDKKASKSIDEFDEDKS